MDLFLTYIKTFLKERNRLPVVKFVVLHMEQDYLDTLVLIIKYFNLLLKGFTFIKINK